jgi:hypothetical protein
MGLLPNGILGNINGTVGPVVTYLLNGQNVIRSKPRKSNKPPTIPQLQNRTELEVITLFLDKAKTLIKKGFKHLAIGTKNNYHNLAVSYNKSQATTGEYPDVKLVFEKILLSKGDLAQPVNPAVERMDDGLKFTWECPESLESGYTSDQVMMMAYSPNLDRSVCIDSGAKRRVMEDVLPLSPSMLKEQLEVYIAFVADDRLQAADSIYLGSLSPV